METVQQDLRLAFRAMLDRPGFTLVIILSLALGVGATTAIFSITNNLLFHPLPFEEADQLIRVRDILEQPEGEPRRAGMMANNFLALREQGTVFTGVAAQDYGSFNLMGTETAERIQGAYITADLMPLLGAEPILGRRITPEEDRSGAPARVVLLGYDLWHRQFGGSEDILGRTILLNSEPYIVIGVMPRSYRYPYEAELWVPMGIFPDPGRATQHYLYTVARLKPGVTKEQAQRELDLIDARLAAQYPEHASWDLLAVPVREDLTDDIQSKLLFALIAAAGFLLLIACANVANMLLARSLEQTREIAIRSALGASRRRLVQQLLTQGLLLAILSGGLGLLFAYLVIEPLIAVSPVAGMSPFFREVQIDYRVLGFTFAISLAVGLFFSLAPALRASKPDLQGSLKEENRSTASIRGKRLLSSFVVAEVAIAVILLVGAGLMSQSFRKLLSVDAGYDTKNLLVLHLALPDSKFPEQPMRLAFIDRLIERVRALPGITAASVTTTNPMDAARIGTMVSFEDFPPADPADALFANHRVVSPQYLGTLGTKLVRGRLLTEQDRADGQPVVVISDEMADVHWKGQDPIGKRVKRGTYDSENTWMTVVGVVRDIMDNGDIAPTWYVPYTQHPFPTENVSLVVRTASEPGSFVPAVRQAVAELDKEQPVYDIATMEDLVSESYSEQRFSMLLFTMYAGLGLVLALVGIYGILTYSVIQQRHELGLRMALGAQRGDLLRRVLRQGASLTALGVVIGLAGAFVLTRYLTSMLHEVSPTDPKTYLGIAASALLVALLASYLPARRATKVDPMVAFRYE